MGELIRNLHEIEIGNERLIVELNEGYSRSQGRVIHIQNKDFRYLIQEKEFLQLATTILRAKSESDYYRKSMAIPKENSIANQHVDADDKTLDILLFYTELLKKHKIKYRILDLGEGYITVIIQENDCHDFHKLIESQKKIKKKEHIYGKKFGYSFIYQMKPFEMYIYKNIILEVFYQLPCLSLTPFMWLPLDRIIQQRIWSEKEVIQNGICWVDDISLYIYKLCWAIFKRRFFSEKDKELFIKKEYVINDDDFSKCMEKVFFGYTDRMKELLRKRKYDEIISDYFLYTDY